jgi:hypothetical protein
MLCNTTIPTAARLTRTVAWSAMEALLARPTTKGTQVIAPGSLMFRAVCESRDSASERWPPGHRGGRAGVAARARGMR